MSDDPEFEKFNQDLFARTVEFLGGSKEDAAMRGLVRTHMSRDQMESALNALANVAASIIAPQEDRAELFGVFGAMLCESVNTLVAQGAADEPTKQ